MRAREARRFGRALMCAPRNIFGRNKTVDREPSGGRGTSCAKLLYALFFSLAMTGLAMTDACYTAPAGMCVRRDTGGGRELMPACLGHGNFQKYFRK